MMRSSSAIYPRTSSSFRSASVSSAKNGSNRPSSSISSRRFSVKRSHNSEIDELLFCSSRKQTNNNEQGHSVSVTVTRPQFPSQKSYDCTPKHRFVKVVSQDLVRDLHVQNNNVKERSLRLSGKEYRRLLDYSTNSQSDYEIRRKNIVKKEMESLERRLEFARYDTIRQIREKPTDLQKINEENSRKLIRKAWEERVDNEDGVKEITNMIKSAKIQTIRDRQIKEKKLIAKLKTEEDMRLDKIIEEENAVAFSKRQELERQRLEKEYIGAHTMYKQIEYNRQRKLEKLDLLAKENLEAKQEAERIIISNMMHKQMLIKEQKRKKEEFVIANKTAIERKIIEQMQEKLIDKQVMKIQMEKAEKERIIEEENLKKKLENEIAYSKMRAVQEKYQDLQVQRDELLEKRSNEEALRRWRERELKEEIKKQEVAEDLRIVRAIQKHMAVVRNATEAMKEKEIFQYHVQKEKALIDKDKLEELTKQNKKHLYAKALHHQIEQNKIQVLVDKYRLELEASRISKDIESREKRIHEAKVRKFEESRSSGVDERYLSQIQNRINNPKHLLGHN